MNQAPEDSPASSAAGRPSLPGATGALAAVLAASCCILPLLLILTGIAGAGIMMTMMQFEWLTLPLGVTGLVAAWALYFGERRRCRTAACRFVGRRANQLALGAATVVVMLALLLRIFPAWTAAVLQAIG